MWYFTSVCTEFTRSLNIRLPKPRSTSITATTAEPLYKPSGNSNGVAISNSGLCDHMITAVLYSKIAAALRLKSAAIKIKLSMIAKHHHQSQAAMQRTQLILLPPRQYRQPARLILLPPRHNQATSFYTETPHRIVQYDQHYDTAAAHCGVRSMRST